MQAVELLCQVIPSQCYQPVPPAGAWLCMAIGSTCSAEVIVTSLLRPTVRCHVLRADRKCQIVTVLHSVHARLGSCHAHAADEVRKTWLTLPAVLQALKLFQVLLLPLQLCILYVNALCEIFSSLLVAA